MKYLYGPLRSRRLGVSLGISTTPYKTCSYDCIYCQLGKTDRTVAERAEYVPCAAVIDELKGWLRAHPQEAGRVDYLTFSGTGEPTLNSGIGELIRQIKELTAIPVAVLTNASLLSVPSVRRALSQADLIVPSLDAATEEVFARIDRPAAGIRLDEVIEGIVKLRQEYQGKLWLEVMLVEGVNDQPQHLAALKAAIGLICPDKVQLNSPVRVTAEPGVVGLSPERLRQICAYLGKACEIV